MTPELARLMVDFTPVTCTEYGYPNPYNQEVVNTDVLHWRLKKEVPNPLTKNFIQEVIESDEGKTITSINFYFWLKDSPFLNSADHFGFITDNTGLPLGWIRIINSDGELSRYFKTTITTKYAVHLIQNGRVIHHPVVYDNTVKLIQNKIHFDQVISDDDLYAKIESAKKKHY